MPEPVEAEVLKAGFAEGRLNGEEYEGYLGRVYSAQARTQLEVATGGLPGGGRALFPVAVPAPARTNALAVASLACGAGQLLAGPLATIPAVLLGHMARHQIRRTGENGDGLAVAGLILGWVGVSLIVLFVTLIGVSYLMFAHSTGHITISNG